MPRVRLALLTACVLTWTLVGALSPAALGDGDPASDVLLGENVYYPYSPAVSASLQKRLNALTATAARAHAPIKVALIDTPIDLGVIPELFGKPQQYSQFLDSEISFERKQELLVVMPDGYGVQGLPKAAVLAAGSIPKPAGKASDDLAAAALAALPKLAAAAGHPLAGLSSHSVPAEQAPAAARGGSGGSVLIIAVLAAAAVAISGTIVALRRRQAAGS